MRRRLLMLDELDARAKAIGLSLFRLAKTAEMSPSTVWRATTRPGGDCRVSTLRRLQEALEREEDRYRKHLATLVPPDGDSLQDGERAA